MTTEERLQIIGDEIKKAEKDLIYNSFCGAEFTTDVYKIPITGRKVQIKVIIQADDDEFESPTKTFL